MKFIGLAVLLVILGWLSISAILQKAHEQKYLDPIRTYAVIVGKADSLHYGDDQTCRVYSTKVTLCDIFYRTVACIYQGRRYGFSDVAAHAEWPRACNETFNRGYYQVAR